MNRTPHDAMDCMISRESNGPRGTECGSAEVRVAECRYSQRRQRRRDAPHPYLTWLRLRYQRS